MYEPKYDPKGNYDGGVAVADPVIGVEAPTGLDAVVNKARRPSTAVRIRERHERTGLEREDFEVPGGE